MAAAGGTEEAPADPQANASGPSRPRLGIVVAGQGSVTPVEAYSALRDSYDPVFLVVGGGSADEGAESEGAAKLASTLRALARRAEVCWLPAVGQARWALPPIRGLNGITTFCADGVEVTARLASEAGLPALAAGGGQGLYDKVAQRAALGPELSPRSVALPAPCCSPERAGCDRHTPCTRQEWERAAERLGLPAVLKPARGQASRGVRRIEDVAGLRAARHEIIAAEEAGDWLLEEYLPGEDHWPRAGYVSVESVVSRSEIRHVALTRKLPMAEPFREVGQYLLPDAPEDPADRALLDATSEALTRLGVQNAVTHTELKLTPRGPKIIEVNARVGGLIRDLVKAGRGVDLARAAAAVAVGDRPDCRQGAATAALVFQYGPLAPVRPAVFERAHGVDDVLSLPGVDRYLPHVAVGESLRGGTETVTMGVVSGACRDEDELAAVLTGLESMVCYEFRFEPDGPPVRCDTRGNPLSIPIRRKQ